MADKKLNTGPEDNKLPEATTPPGTNDPPTPGKIKSPGDPPGHEQAVIPGMVEDMPAPAGKVIDLSGIKAAADHKSKGPIAPDAADIPPEAAPASGDPGNKSAWRHRKQFHPHISPGWSAASTQNLLRFVWP